MRRPLVALLALAVLGCGEADETPTGTTGAGDAAPDADAGAEDAHDAAGDEPEPDIGPEPGSDATGQEDAPPRCPAVEPAELEATFTEKRVAAGATHACGIRDDGTVACWSSGEGGKYFGYAVPPPGKFVRVAAGKAYTCGIRTDGEVECWGVSDTYEPVGTDCPWPDSDCERWLTPPGPFIEITAGGWDTCGLHPDFTIECWGGEVEAIEPPCGQFVQMSVHGALCAVDAEGGVECVPGFPMSGWELPTGGYWLPRDEPIRQVALDDNCACYLYASGEAQCGEIVPSDPKGWTHHLEVRSRKGVGAVSCGWNFPCFILEDGSVRCGFEVDAEPDGGADGGVEAGTEPTYSEISCGMGFCISLLTDGQIEPPDFP